MRLVAADIGGTSSRFAISSLTDDHGLEGVSISRYSSTNWPEFSSLYAHFLADNDLIDEQVDLLVLALPGVIHGKHARLTNLPWTVDSGHLCSQFPISRVEFINDFQAAANGLGSLSETDVCHLNEARILADRPRVVTGAGTGLGMAYQVGSGLPWVTEGGHVDFAPVDEEQGRLLDFLSARFPRHVSYERILSGPGIEDLYRFITGNESGDIPGAAEIGRRAKPGRDDEWSRVLRLFTHILGAFAGNLALMFQPFGGLYLAGGIAPKIQDWLKSDEFMEYYSAKGRMSDLVSGIPVILVLNEDLGLRGALAHGINSNKQR